MNILLIDDEPIIHQSLGSFLRRVGHEVQIALNGKEGLSRVMEQTPDLVISDIKMPGLNGLDLLTHLKIHSPQIPVLLITGHGDMDTAVAALQIGAHSYLCKPVKLDQLIETVQVIEAQQNSLANPRAR